MKVVLIRDQKILHKAGETVNVSPEVYDFLITTGTAKPVETEQDKPKQPRKRSK